MELIILKEKKLNLNHNQNEFKKTKEKNVSKYIIHQNHYQNTYVNSYHSHHSHHCLIKFLKYAIIYLVLVSIVCKVKGKSNNGCGGRIKLTQPKGFITDGKKNYSPDLQCTWLIDASDFKTDTLIRLKFTEFETECSWDHLYLFSGDSVFSPLVAAFSGVLIKRGSQNLNDLPELEIKSKQVYLYFYSDTAYNMSGFNLTYSIHPCKDNDCSKVSLSKPLPEINLDTNSNIDYSALTMTDHCSIDKSYSNNTNCNCNDGINSLVCNMPICPNKCSSQGECDLKEKKCNCKLGFSGADCGQIMQESYWEALNYLKNQKILGRALHQSVLVNDKIWVVGGEFFQKSEANEQFIINFDIKLNKWNIIEKQPSINLKRFSHSLVHFNQSLYMYGGQLENGTISNELWKYDIEQNRWSLVDVQYKQEQCSHTTISYDYCAPLPVSGHTAVVVDNRMIVIFGYNPKYGYLNTVQEFHFISKAWQLLNPAGALIKGGFGHSSVYHQDTKTIYVYGGHHSFLTDSTLVDYLYAYLPYKNKWRLLTSSKSPRYFHSASIINNQMYVYGGNSYNSTNDNNSISKCFSTQFLIYNIPCNTWNSISELSDSILNNIGTGRFGHTSVVYNNEMYIFGGFNGIISINMVPLNNMLKYIPTNCSQFKNRDDCCKSVHKLNCVWDDEKKSCMEYNEDMALLNNRINTAITNSKKNHLGSSAMNNENDQTAKNDFCLFNFNNVYNLNSSNPSNPSNDYFRSKCPIKFSNDNDMCKRQTTCPSCLENSYNCVWCDDSCYSEKCKKTSKRQSRNLLQCDAEETSTLQFNCAKFHNCASCHVAPYCTWGINNMCFPFVEKSGNRTVKAVLHDNLRPPCDPPCHLQTSCENCTLNSCMWCSSLNRCIESNAYGAIFPLAQCMEWTIHPSKCQQLSCLAQGTCEACQKIHRCGWCDDGTGTGSGFCTEGNSKGPLNLQFNALQDNSTSRLDKLNNPNKHLSDVTNRIANLDSTFLNKNAVNILDLFSVNKPGRFLPFQSTNRNLQTCKADKWYYTECGMCQCNGHSQCKPFTSICNKPCLHDTEGEHCEECKPGFYGNPINGGKCSLCKCNNSHSVPCDKRTGRCFCTTKGIIGHLCDRCDEQNHYFVNKDFFNPKVTTCYYNLSIDFQYTFNMSKSDDKFFNKINFMNTPHRPDLDVDFTITCSNRALFNITFGSATLPQRVLHQQVECNQFKFRFSHHENLFGAENGSFYVSVYDFSYPFILQISFSQHRALDLIQFFVTFSSCFLTLLILAAILWKIKQKYDMYRRRQQFFMELEHLASRPFAGILLEIPSNQVKNQPTSPIPNSSNEESNTTQQTLPPATTNKPSKLKAFTSAQKSHLKYFLNSGSNNGTETIKPQQATPINSQKAIENPTPIALEPCFNNKAAVLSLIVRLPTGGTGVIPIGQTGIAIASALVSLGPVEQKMHDNLKNTSSNKKTNNPAFV